MVVTSVRRGGSLLLLVLGVLLLALIAAPAAHACSCQGLTVEEAVEHADLIADVRVEHPLADDGGEVTYFAVVDTVWKGEESRTIRLTTHEQSTACGLGAVPRGTELRVWATGEDGEYSSSWCNLPMGAGDDLDEQLVALEGEPVDLTGEPVPLTRDAVPRPPLWAGPALAVAGIAGLRLAGLVVVAVLVVRRRAGS